MNRYNAIGLLALVILVAVLPIYALLEPYRLDDAQAALRQNFVAEGADMYVENCARCHGAGGEGVGPMPALNNPALASADRDVLYSIIAHSPHGTAMSAWHVDEGGSLSSYQVEGLVTLIANADWEQVGVLAVQQDFVAPTPAAPEVELATMEGVGEDPHECRACHEEPAIHAERFGLNCSRCHTLDAWEPAQLTRHTFLLDHGAEGKVACQTCHTRTYSEHTCYECHDHQPEEMQAAHAREDITDFEQCAQCHPTGREGEAAALGYGLSGRADREGAPQDGDPGQAATSTDCEPGPRDLMNPRGDSPDQPGLPDSASNGPRLQDQEEPETDASSSPQRQGESADQGDTGQGAPSGSAAEGSNGHEGADGDDAGGTGQGDVGQPASGDNAGQGGGKEHDGGR